MQESFNPYAAFLGFPPGRTPRNYYELLGLPLLEPDPEKISQAVERLRNQVRQIRPGGYLVEWQQVLDELTAAKICLLDPVAKAFYDESLQKGAYPTSGGKDSIPPVPQAKTPPTAGTHVMLSGEQVSPGYFFPPAPSPGPGPQYTQSDGVSSVHSGGFLAEGPPPPGIPRGTPVAFQRGYHYTYSGGEIPEATDSPTGWPTTMPQMVPPSQPGAAVYPPEWRTWSGQPAGVSSPGATASPSGWPTSEFQGHSREQGGSANSFAGFPLGLPGTPPAGPTPPPCPGETTQVAAKTASVQSRRSLAWGVAVCVGLMLLAGGLLYLLQRVRTEGPEVILGKLGKIFAKKSTSRETASLRPNGQIPSVISPGAGHPPQKQHNGKAPFYPPSPSNSPHSPSPSNSSVSTAPESVGPSETPKSSHPGKESTWPIGPSEKAGPGMSEKPSPGPGKKPPSPVTKLSLDPAKQSAWQTAVEEVRSALAQHDLASAQEALKIAETNAQTSEEHDVVERLRILRHYLGEFWNGIRQAVIRLEATQEFTVGSTRFAIVEGNSQYLIVRAEGRNIRWPIERIPGSVVELLAKRWFRTNNAATQLAFGAYYAVRGQKQDARQYWEQAAKSGSADAKALLEELRHWPLPEPKSPGGLSPLQ